MAPPLQHSAPTLPPRTAITNRLRERLPPRTNYAGTSRITRVQDSGSRPLDTAPEIQAGHPRQTIIGDKNYYGREFEHDLTERHLTLLRPARKGEPERAGAHLFKPLRQVIESINQTLKGQLDLEPHGGKTPAGGPPGSSCASSR